MFGLFAGSQRRRATEAGVAAIRPLIGTLQSDFGSGIPPGFWEDPYVLGFCHNLIRQFGKLSSRGKLQGEDVGYVAIDVFSTVSNMNGTAIAKRVVALANSKDPDFTRGADDAWLLFGYTYRLLADEDSNSLVRVAAIGAKAAGKPGDRATVAGLITHSTFYAHARQLAEQARAT